MCWEWKGLARDEGEAAAAWFTKVLGKPSRLVRFVGAPAMPCRAHAGCAGCVAAWPGDPAQVLGYKHSMPCCKCAEGHAWVMHACRATGHKRCRGGCHEAAAPREACRLGQDAGL